MKKVISKVFFYLFPLLLILTGFELFYRLVPNNYTLKYESIQRRYNDTEVLIFGNSHTFYGLNPIYFNKPTFNISNVSQSLYFDQLLFEKYIDKFDKLEYVILNVEYFTLSQVDDSGEDVRRKYYYESYMDLDVPTVSMFDPKGYVLSSTRNIKENIEFVGRYFSEGTITDCNKNGFGINHKADKKLLNIEEIAPFSVKRHEDYLTDFAVNKSRMQSIINQCKKRGIKVILVTMPVSKYYAERVNQVKLNKIFKTCLSIEKANRNVHYLNLFKDNRFTNSDFFDPDHLHDEGAKKCSLILNEFIKTF